MRVRIVLCTFLLLCAAIAGAQQQQPPCVPSDTIEQCWQRYNPPLAMATAAAASAVNAEVATANTGMPAMTLPTGSSLKDFLSLFNAAVQTATVTENDEAVTLDWNVPFNVFGDDKIKFQAIFTEATLSADVKTELGSNTAATTTLTDSLTETDDIQASASYAPQNAYFGRSIRQHGDLLAALIESATGDDEKRELQLLAQTSFAGVTTEAKLQDLAPGVATQIESSARAEQQIAARNQDVLKAFATLLGNQPQIYGTVVYHYRNRLAGPSDLSAKFSYEASGNSLNRFLRRNRERCSSAAIAQQANGLDVSTTCVGALSAYAKQIAGDMNAGGSNRLAVSFEYKRSDANRFSLTEPAAITVNTPGSHSLVYTIAYGVPMSTTVDNREGRFDFAVNYEDVSNDPMKTDRLIASVTYSQKLTDTVTLPLSLVYANHADYLPATDRRVGVHFGLNYKLPDPTP
jgi:hypothetical protein